MKSNNKIVEQAVAHHRRYCMSCGTRLAQTGSRRVGLCQACRRHCVCCGRQTGTYGYYDVCLKCRTVIDRSIEHMKRHKRNPPPEENGDCACLRATHRQAPARRASCAACGDPAEMTFDGRPYCAECHAEKEAGDDHE